ncbi:glutathione-disulfide reductase [Oxynema aestuarii]|jgi:glutathione reductase (NADPH)|uniref:Glutathione reductase n=1 Tax=Oxynema aestuarii AP17 TaxID=2064643 RepID=A0A6H1TZT9_9CYAN|nr:glutathione-disulfide reductase [Oxynema aestuarii]QIZ71706.1 glutathione-disulfide reductase [Oxynema aestuarii AP17]RMH78153.1 MAG: glutathione-disulfide reductase [Cyanobacteria bacterium J007]
MSYDYDLLVIGAGSGGLAASKRAASYGAKVAIVENDLVGGTCVIRGCVPKKLMVYASTFSHLYDDAVGYGWSEVKPSFDWKKLVEVVDNEVMRLNQVHIKLLEKAGVELIKGLGRFVDPHTVDVGDRQITADKILIAVGGAPVKPENIPGIEHTITSREMFHLPEFPKRFAVLGGGYIGVEFAGIMNGLGAEVTEIIRREKILRGFDEDIRTDIQAGMTEHGVNFLTNTEIEKIEKTDEGLKLTLTGDNESLVVDTILCATGRKPKPQLDPLNLDNAGVEVRDEAIAVTEDSATSQPHIYAVGDCTDRLNLTPVAIAEGRAFADTVFGHIPRYISHKGVPSAVFAQPEGATVGMTEKEAIADFGEDRVKVYRGRFRPMFHSLTGANEKVMVKLVVEKTTDRVLGVHMVGKDAAEIIQGMAIAVNMGATKKDFDATIGIHPSTSEEFVTLR